MIENQTKNEMPVSNKLYRLPIVKQVTGKSRSTHYRDIQRGLMTKPVSIGGDRVAWPSNEIEAIVKARIAGADDEKIKQLVAQLEAARAA